MFVLLVVGSVIYLVYKAFLESLIWGIETQLMSFDRDNSFEPDDFFEPDDLTRRIYWDYLDKGSYNYVYYSMKDDMALLHTSSHQGPWVYKKPVFTYEADQCLSEPSRAIRVFNELNPALVAGLYEDGWVAPFLGYDAPTDKEVAREVLSIYKKNRRIVVDACGKGNFIKYDDQVICVDVDQAMRRGSLASEELLHVIHRRDHYELYWSKHETLYGKPKTVQVIRALLYLESCVEPSEIIVDLITDDTISLLTMYRLSGQKVTMALLLQEPMNTISMTHPAKELSLDDDGAASCTSASAIFFKPKPKPKPKPEPESKLAPSDLETASDFTFFGELC